MKTEKIVEFVEFLHLFGNVKRTVKIKGGGFENDVEHSYQLALMTWYIADSLKWNLNRQLILEYALVHDLVEVYSGDTDMFKDSKEHIASKHEREEKAQLAIKNNFPDFISLHQSIESYKLLKDKESQLIYMIDKILPDMNIYLTNDNYYVDNKVTYEMWRVWLQTRIDKIPKNDEMTGVIDNFVKFVKEKTRFYS